MELKDKIHTIRDRQVMLDKDLAELYGVSTKVLNQAVRRNLERFPPDFMFRLKKHEYDVLKSQTVTASSNHGGRRNLPYAFTQEGVSMLSGVLRSRKATDINIKIMRAFVSMKRFISTNAKIFSRLDRVEMKQVEHDKNFEKVFEAIEDRTLKPKQGIFYDGQVFDAYSFVSSLIRSADDSIILIDNFVDERTLNLFAKMKKHVSVKIYSKNITKQLKADIQKFKSQYGPVHLERFDLSHDRFLIIDEIVYHFGASLKDLGKRWFAFSKIESPDILGRLKNDKI